MAWTGVVCSCFGGCGLAGGVDLAGAGEVGNKKVTSHQAGKTMALDLQNVVVDGLKTGVGSRVGFET